MIRTTPILLLVAAATFLATVAQAQVFNVPTTRTVNVKVKFGDLDLNKPEDAQVLYLRLESAAKRACGPVNTPMYGGAVTAPSFRHGYKSCVGTALGDVITRLNDPLLSRIYAETHKAKSVDVASR